MRRAVLLIAVTAASALAHETLTTTVLFDREIVRILDRHCVMCHVENGPSFPLATYEETWLRGRQIRAEVLRRHMPPWSAVPGYGQFVNDNSLTLRESQFIISWVEGLGPRNGGTVFSNVVDPDAKPRPPVRAHVDFGGWQLGEPDVKRPLTPHVVEARQGNTLDRAVVETGLVSERRLRALEYVPRDRRVVRAAFFTVRETGQWIGSWTPWYGFTRLPAGAAYRLPAGAHIVAEIRYRGTKERVVESGTLGLFFAGQPARNAVPDLVMETKGGPERYRAETRLMADTRVVAFWPQFGEGVRSIEVSARRSDGGTEVLLFIHDPTTDWPTPYVLKQPVLLRRGTVLSVTSYSAGIRLTVSRL